MSISKSIKFIPNLPAVTPSPSPRIRGSVLVSFNKDVSSNYSYEVIVNNQIRTLNYMNISNLYNTYVYLGDVVTINITTTIASPQSIYIDRRDYTTDDQGGDNGIRDTFINSITNSSTLSSTLSFIVSTEYDAYDF
jgi:hypothetical protein